MLATTTNMQAATLTEGFETKANGTYKDASITGDAGTWNTTDAGVYANKTNETNARTGNNGLRFGSTTTSTVAMGADKSGGAGKITFYAAKWGSDATATVAVEYSTDKGSTWKSAGTASVSNGSFTAYNYTVNVSGNVRLRLRQTAGKRVLIDDINITDYSSSSTTTAKLTSPVNGSTVDFGTNAANTSKTMSVNVKGTGLTQAMTVSVSGTGFTANTSSLSASKVNSTSGATLQLYFKGANGGSYTGTLTLTSGTLTVKVNLRATVSGTGSGTGSGTTTTAQYTTPKAGSTVDFSTVTANKSKTATVVVKGTGLTESTTVTVTGTGFKTGSATLSAAKVNSDAGAQLQIVFKAADAGKYTGTLKLVSGSLKRSVSLKAQVGGTTATEDPTPATPTEPSTPTDPTTPTDPDAVTGNEPTGYYSTAEGKCGQALLSALCTKIKSHTSVSYNNLWTAFKDTDTKSNGKIWDMYSTKEFTYKTNQCGNYTRVGDCYNREHSFPKSWFSEATPMYTDLFHLIPTDGFVNNQRGNNPFGECANGTYVAANGTVKAMGKLGKSTYSGYTGTVWEPDDQYKGDFARAYFYMVTAYNDKVSKWSSPMLAGNAYPAFTTWAVDMLLKWNRLDPVSKKETDRQEAVYAKQKNRNPFIDHPELADYIWGTKKSTAWNAAAANSAVITYPSDGSTLNFGTVATQASNEKLLNVKGVRVNSDVNVAIEGNGFNASAEWLSADEVNQLTNKTKAPRRVAAATDGDETGAWLKISFTVDTDSEYSALLTLTSGTTVNKVTLKGRARDGLPAGDAEDITADGFTARWVNVGDELADGKYRLDVADAGGILAGYPVYVDADALEYRVDGLLPNTTYTYSLTSETMQSNIVEATTGDVTPSIVFVYANDALDFVAEPQTASTAVELQMESEYIDGNVTLAIEAPFQISDDKTSWAQTLTVDTEKTDRIFVRLAAADAGNYTSSLKATAANYYTDAVVAQGLVVGGKAAMEDFEASAKGHDTYTAHTYQGTMGPWDMANAGIWTTDTPYAGKQAARFGKNADSSIKLTTPLASVATVAFQAAKWKGDADAKVELQYSTDNGESWKSAGTAEVTSESYKPFTFNLSLPQTMLIRLQQTAGARLLVDNIEVAPCTTAAPSVTADQYQQWNAYSAAHGQLTIEAECAEAFTVVGIDGKVYRSGRLEAGVTTFELAPQMLYIVNVGETARRVYVK